MAKKKTKDKKKEEVAVVGLYDKAIDFSAQAFEAGYSESKIAELLQSSFPRFSPENIQLVIHRGSLKIADRYVRDRKSIISLHIKRYDQEIQEIKRWFEEEEYENIDIKFQRDVMLGQLDSAITVLTAKEKVLQMHAKETQVRIFNKLNAKVKKKEVMFDLKSLTLEEKIELLSLMRKAKKTDLELMSVTLNSDRPINNTNTEDIEYEEVPVSANVTKIKQTNIPKPERVIPPVYQLSDLTDKIRATLALVAQKQFEEKGAKKIAPTVKHQDEP